MAKKEVKIAFTVIVDEEEVGRPANIWVHQFINRLGYEHEITEVKIGNDRAKKIKTKQDLVDLPIKRQRIN